MENAELLKSRIRQLSASNQAGECVLYVMSRDQRLNDNHALIAAQKHAIARKLPLAVVFCLYDKVGVRAREHYEFMIAGLYELERELAKKAIPFLMVVGDPFEKLSAVIHHTKPDAVYFDFNPLRDPRKLQSKLSKSTNCAMYIVDTHNIVPVWVTSDKQEVGAYTIRPKIHKKFGEYLVSCEPVVSHPYTWPGTVQSLTSLQGLIDEVLQNQISNGTSIATKSGEQAAQEHLNVFIADSLVRYAVDRNDPSSGSQSGLSPYLHFGQMSALTVALRLRERAVASKGDLHFMSSPKMPKPEEAEITEQHGIDSLIEEMVVRKELADNYCYYNPHYDSLEAAPAWARSSLDKHRKDPREHLYSYNTLVEAQTHDEAWNAAQRQLTMTGKMHGYMRMYWAKKVLEWTESPEQAIDFLIRINDFYSIDGGDPNGYAGILWSVAGVHDRPWNERSIFGVVRYMNYGGLKRKFAIADYEHQWSAGATLDT